MLTKFVDVNVRETTFEKADKTHYEACNFGGYDGGKYGVLVVFDSFNDCVSWKQSQRLIP